ncbi:MAG TPA: response regulator [Vicingus sp.]|nr:response regulator [Vicingus sp.]HRP59862.1 response regulator [Vicingus sp.]
MEGIKVLYIDDEKDNLEAFKASFRRIFDVYLAENAQQGIEILKKHTIEVVIADQRMPETTGVEFFEFILHAYPNPMRILLTGYSDINAVRDAINKGQVYRYISKPWDEFEFKTTIEDAYQFYQLREQNNKLQNKYQKIFSESSDAILILDEMGRIIDYNKGTLSLLEIKRRKLNLTHFSNFIANKHENDYIFKTIFDNGFIKNYECKLTSINGKEISCLISANRITDNYGVVSSYQIIIRDITSKTINEQLLLKTIISTQDDEKSRISRNLHDSLGQTLVGIKYQLDYLKTVSDPQIYSPIIETTIEAITSTIQQLRRICYEIVPPSLTEFGIQSALEQLGKKFQNNDIKIITEFKSQLPNLNKDTEVAIYRITQEFLANSFKHSNCNQITIASEIENTFFWIILKDNGIGFDSKIEGKGFGLKNIISRVESFHGSINIQSNKNKGTEFRIKIPIN